jgi:phospho-N-acetylmuramoyl-pentapeptide-transferase
VLYNFLYQLSEYFSFFNVFKYLTVRTSGALLTSLLIVLFSGEKVIRALKAKQKRGQPIRSDGPESHLAKAGTPTMGGILILGSTIISSIFWANLTSPFVLLFLFIIVGFGLIGAYDDLKKLSQGDSKGMQARWKFAAQGTLSVLVALALLQLTPSELHYRVAIPFFKNLTVYIGWFYFLWGICVITGTSNAVNLTDGLDGLAIVPVMYVASSFLLISYLVGHSNFSDYLYIHHIPGAGELTVPLGALIGGCLGFLWFNAPPAKIFMGDSGSLSIGATLGGVSMMVHHELVLCIVGGLFVVEAVSVILQVAIFKCTKGRKRIFLMAPIHHHFEKKGWPESTITIRFWIIATILALLGLTTLKLR